MITLDFETYYSKEYSLSKMTTEAYIRDPRFQVIGVSVKVDDGPIEWITGNHLEIKQALSRYDFDKVLCHNAVFDGAILSWIFDIHPHIFFDTLSMSRPLTGVTVGGSLRALADMFNLGKKGDEIYNTLGKRREDFTSEELARFGEYCRQDVNLTYKLFFKLLPFVTRHELFFINLFIKMYTEPRIVLDKERLEKHLANVRNKKAELLAKVSVDRTELMSNQKFAEQLKSRGVAPPMKTSPTTGKETYAFAKTDLAFKALLDHPNEQVQALVAARLGCKSTIEETRTENLIGVSNRGCLPIMLNYWGAATGRASGGDSMNLQNLPRGGEIRKSLCAPPGYVLVACDSSNIEARMNAWFCGEESMLSDFRSNKDVYASFATTIYGKPINKHDHPLERFVGKTCLGAETKVLTDHGWKQIIDVTTDDRLWDGEEFVWHMGLIEQGRRYTVSGYGVKATPDHLCLVDGKFLPWKSLVEDGSLFQKALTSVTLPSSDIVIGLAQGKTVKRGALAGSLIAFASAVGKVLFSKIIYCVAILADAINALKGKRRKNAGGNTRPL